MGLPCSLSDPPSMYTYTYAHARTCMSRACMRARTHTHKHAHIQNKTLQGNIDPYTPQTISYIKTLTVLRRCLWAECRAQIEERCSLLGLRCCPQCASSVPSSFPSLDALRSLCLPYAPSPPPPPPPLLYTDPTGSVCVFTKSRATGLEAVEESSSRWIQITACHRPHWNWSNPSTP